MASSSSVREKALKACALGQSREMGWGGRWERGLGWGDTCIAVADSFRSGQKPPQYYKVISCQLKKNGNFIFNFLRSLHMILHLHQQCAWVPISPHPCQNLFPTPTSFLK